MNESKYGKMALVFCGCAFRDHLSVNLGVIFTGKVKGT